MKIDRSNWMDVTGKMRSLERKAKEKLGVEGGPFSRIKCKRKYGLKGDSRPEQLEDLEVKKFQAKAMKKDLLIEAK
jgi:hypothetical protein